MTSRAVLLRHHRGHDGLRAQIGTNALGADGNGVIANTVDHRGSGNTITIGYVPEDTASLNDGVLGDIPAGTTLTFSSLQKIPISCRPGRHRQVDRHPFTYEYEFNQSKLIVAEPARHHPIYGAAIPGAERDLRDRRQNIFPYYQSVPTAHGYTGYVTGGWTGIGSGYPSAIGYMSPTHQGSVYIAPNMTFDFTEIQYQGKTVAQAEADWAAQFDALTRQRRRHAHRRLAHPRLRRRGVGHHDQSATTRPTPRRCITDFIAQAYSRRL